MLIKEVPTEIRCLPGVLGVLAGVLCVLVVLLTDEFEERHSLIRVRWMLDVSPLVCFNTECSGGIFYVQVQVAICPGYICPGKELIVVFHMLG